MEGAFDGKEVEKGRRGERGWVAAPQGLALIPPGNEIIIIIIKKREKKKSFLIRIRQTDGRRDGGRARCCPHRCTFQAEYLEKLENEPENLKDTEKHLPILKISY